MASAPSLSHLTLTAPIAKFENVVAFYSHLGFRLVAKQDTETWLHLFSTSESGRGLTLRIKSVPDSHGNESVDFGSIKKRLEGNVDTLDEEFLSLSIPDTVDVEGMLSTFTHDFYTRKAATTKSPTAGGAPALETFVLDPTGRLLKLTNSPPAFSVSQSTLPPAANAKLLSQKMTYGSIEQLNPILDAYLPLDRTPQVGTETGVPIKVPGTSISKRIGILTSGGDSSGMNAAVRAITRVALQRGCVPYAIYEGYEGLVEGGDKIRRLTWDDVRGFLSIGGTVIGTARSARFRTREGRLLAALNMIKNGIDALVVVGGDGSLTGADKMRQEWQGLVDELVETGKVEKDECSNLREHLTIVGLVGSIDNDMSSTDITIGAVTSLHRICESLDSLTSTAMSHQRAFVVEVMGRHCGWLGLMAAISVGADWVFLPERPPPLDTGRFADKWEDELCEKLAMNRKMGNRVSLVIVCEGAIDRHLNPIKPDYVKTILETRLGLDTRVTTLGHVQRGGTPCAYDRYLATVQGVEAVEAVLRSTPDTPAPMIGMSQNKITAGPLMDAVKLTHDVADAIAKKDFARAMELRDPDFNAAYDSYIESHLFENGQKVADGKGLRIGIIHVGAPAGGMNAATRTAARLCLNRGHTPLGIRDGFSGLIRDKVFPLTWQEVIGWQVKGGSELGTNRDHPQPVPGAPGPKISPKGVGNFVDCGLIAYHLQKHNIQALLIIGGFEGFTSLMTLAGARSIFPALCIPMIILPATVSNNVPGTDFSIGSDTALNAIVESCDRIKLSASASQKRVFVVEVQGGNCGYLAVVAGLASGATTVYIPEEGISIDQLQNDVRHLCRRYASEKLDKGRGEGRVILRAEMASSETYTTEVVSAILRAEGKGFFDSRTSVLGHLQQGGVPSPLDRIRATRLAVNCVDWIEEKVAEAQQDSGLESKDLKFTVPAVYTTRADHACVIGIRGANVVFTPVNELLDETDVGKRRGKTAWWMGLRRLIKVLSKYYYHEDEQE
ncbi:6-phosphofructokinase, alpha subunit [Blyttiomyces sp. JEL0837]|nr:6-phosphofructokinase, alpha subunit [Blyttiomyces sp. JEL0837]